MHTVISRDELIATVWANRTVSDDAINRCVSILRHGLSPDDRHAYIETVVRKGYIAHFPPADDVAPTVSQAIQGRTIWLLAIFLAVAAVFICITVGREQAWDAPKVSRAGPPMVAVLPFVTASQASESEFFATGVHDDLLTQLAKLQSMRVISNTSVMEYRNVRHNIRKIGEELGADVILEGSVQISANRIRINAQLIDARTDEHLWADTFDRVLSPANIFEVQSEIARIIAGKLDATLTPQDNKQLSMIPTRNMPAYLAYHRAMRLREPSGSNIGRPEYLRELEQAVVLDPSFSLAWAELIIALAYRNLSGDKPE